MTPKTRIIVSNILIIFGLLCLASGFVILFVAKKEVLGIVLMFVVGLVSVIAGGVFWEKSGHPTVEQPKVKKPKKQKQPKTKKLKQPFMTEEEWREQEEEDDEMMFIEEVVEDD